MALIIESKNFHVREFLEQNTNKRFAWKLVRAAELNGVEENREMGDEWVG